MTDLDAKYLTLSRYIPAITREVELWQEEARSVQIYIQNFKGQSSVDLEILYLRLTLALGKVKELTGFND